MILSFDYEWNIREQRWDCVLAYLTSDKHRYVSVYILPEESLEVVLSDMKKLVRLVSDDINRKGIDIV